MLRLDASILISTLEDLLLPRCDVQAWVLISFLVLSGELRAERVLMKPHDRRLPRMIIDGDNVKAQRTFFHVAFGKEALRRSHHDSLLLSGHAEFWERGGVFLHCTRPNFHKCQRLAVVAD